MLQNQEYIQEFVDEAKSHLEKVETGLLNSAAMTADSDAVNDVFRAVHSIKGTAGFFGLKKIVALAHAMENVFGEIRSGRYAMTETMEEVLFEANDRIKAMVENVLSSEEQAVSDLVDLINQALQSKGVELPATKLELTNQQCKFAFDGTASELMQEGLKHGHKVYVIRLSLNRDLLNCNEGPVKLFRKLETMGVVVDTQIDYAEINSLDDVLAAAENLEKDVYFEALVTTVLERCLLAEAIGVGPDQVTEVHFEAEANKYQTAPSMLEPRELSVLPQTAGGISPPESETKPVLERQTETVSSHKSVKPEDSIRVHVSILNDLLDMAGEMVLGRNQLLRTLEAYRKTIPGLGPILQNIDRLTTGMQERIMMTRMQPVANVFNKFPRIIRDISKSINKEIELVIEGADVELDKSMIEALTDPLTHLVRNAADHGIEESDKRSQAGKPGCGKIILRAYHEGGYVNIDVIDDGKGLDAEKIKKAAIEKELININQIEHLNEAEVLKLIFRPGFSTADKISDLSGRGVGMDVVKTNIEKMGGSIELFTSKGMGTTIRLMLPLTLAIIQSLIVEVEGRRFALPQVNLKEIVRIKPGDVHNRLEYVQGAEVMRLRGRLLPVIHLADVLGIPRTYQASSGERKPDRRKFLGDQRLYETTDEELAGEVVSRRNSLDNVQRVLILKIGNRMFGIAVDSIIGGEETLVKPLPIYLKECICYSGVTILGDGKTAVILDPEGIIRLADLKFRDENDSEAQQEELNASELVEYQNLLLFKCSGPETLALDLSVVSRVEEIKASDLQCVGEQEFIMFNSDTLRVIRPENYLPIGRNAKTPDKYYVIIPKLVCYPVGILIEQLYDNIQDRINLDTEEIVSEGLIGSAVYHDRLILIMNIYELFERADPLHYQRERLRISESRRVLLVEDTQFFQRIELKYLQGAGYEVTLAHNGREAWELLAKTSFDLVVSDIHMPVMDGLELVKNIRSHPKLNALPVIALTSITEERLKLLGLESGFDYFEWKLDRDSLLITMEQALRLGRGEAVV